MAQQRKRDERSKEKKDEREKEKAAPPSPLSKEAPSAAALPISLIVAASSQELAGRAHISQTLMNQLLLQAGDLLLLKSATATSEVLCLRWGRFCIDWLQSAPCAIAQAWPAPAANLAPRNRAPVDFC